MSPPITTIRLENIQFHAPIGCDAWGRPAKATQPVSVSLAVRVLLSRADHASDDLDRSLDYSKLASLVVSVAQDPDTHQKNHRGRWDDALRFHEAVYLALQQFPDLAAIHDYAGIARDLEIATTLPVGTLGAGATATWRSRHGLSPPDASRDGLRRLQASGSLDVTGIRATTVIGVKAHELLERQSVVVDVSVDIPPDGDHHRHVMSTPTAAHSLVHAVVSMVEQTHVLTVEALVEKVWDAVRTTRHPPLKVKVLKPDAVGFVGGCGVELEVRSGGGERTESGSQIDERREELDSQWWALKGSLEQKVKEEE